jgi:hypothetical protein
MTERTFLWRMVKTNWLLQLLKYETTARTIFVLHFLFLFQAQPNTVVVVHTPGAVLMPWINSVAAAICAWLPGQEDGTIITSVICNVKFGIVVLWIHY